MNIFERIKHACLAEEAIRAARTEDELPSESGERFWQLASTVDA